LRRRPQGLTPRPRRRRPQRRADGEPCALPPNLARAWPPSGALSCLRELLESPLQERVGGSEVPALPIRPQDSRRFRRVPSEVSDKPLDVPQGTGHVVHDRDGCPSGRPREGVEIDADDRLAHLHERLRAVAILKRDEDDVRAVDPFPVAQCPFRFEPRNPCIRPRSQDMGGAAPLEDPHDRPHPPFRAVEEIHLDGRGDRPRQTHDVSCGERGDVPVHGDHRMRRKEECRSRRLLCDEGGRARLLAEQIVEGLSSAMGDESLGDDDAGPPCPDELLPPHERLVPRMGLRDSHNIPLILSTNFAQPCQRGSAAGIPYFASHSRTVVSTCSRVMFSWLIARPNTFAPREKNSSHSISSSTVGIGHATTSLRKFLVLRAGACIMRIADGKEAMMIARVPHTYAGWEMLPWPSTIIALGFVSSYARTTSASSSPTMKSPLIESRGTPYVAPCRSPVCPVATNVVGIPAAVRASVRSSAVVPLPDPPPGPEARDPETRELRELRVVLKVLVEPRDHVQPALDRAPEDRPELLRDVAADRRDAHDHSLRSRLPDGLVKF